MAPEPYNNTGILKVAYEHEDFGLRHMIFRAGDGYNASDLVELAADFISDGLVPIWFTQVACTGATWQDAGSDFSLPVPFPPLAGTASGSLGTVNVPRFLSLSGRGIVTGREARVTAYFTNVVNDTNYRYSVGESAAVDTLIEAYITYAVAGGAVTIGKDPFVVRPYANSGVNAYWQRRARVS